MKKTVFILVAMLAVCTATSAAAQSVVVTPKKVTYRRKSPDAPTYKKSFAITYPKISRAGGAGKKLEDALSFEKAFGFKLDDEVNSDTGLDLASYKVLYNNQGILNILLTEEYSAAYPSTGDKSVVLNSVTGDVLRAGDIFTKLPELAGKVSKMQQAEIQKAIIQIKREQKEIEDPQEMFENADFTSDNLDDFQIGARGITFRYDYGFPHVTLALQPPGRYFFSWIQLKPYIKRDGLLAKFVR
jgi:hypothetical protein